MASITIEGSLSPSSFLARGERRTVQDSDYVQKLIEGGYVTVIEDDDDAEAPELTPEEREAEEVVADLSQPQGVEPPKRSASREDWAEFLASYPGGEFVTEDKDRAELIAAWDEHVKSSSVADDQE
jgi:hypothetical protein